MKRKILLVIIVILGIIILLKTKQKDNIISDPPDVFKEFEKENSNSINILKYTGYIPQTQRFDQLS